jgi:hypothetical protein
MKRLIAAVSFAVLANPVLADNGKPFEQLDIDRALPNVAERTVTASSGNTRSDVEISTEANAASSWENDHNFIAPAK